MVGGGGAGQSMPPFHPVLAWTYPQGQFAVWTILHEAFIPEKDRIKSCIFWHHNKLIPRTQTTEHLLTGFDGPESWTGLPKITVSLVRESDKTHFARDVLICLVSYPKTTFCNCRVFQWNGRHENVFKWSEKHDHSVRFDDKRRPVKCKLLVVLLFA